VESSGFFISEQQPSAEQVLIAKGGASSIHRVRYENKFMVLKQLAPEFQGKPQYVSSLLREFEIGFVLNHPNIVQYHSCNQDLTSPSILMEYIDGETLFTAINSPNFHLDDQSIRKLLVQLLDVLEYLHSQQLYHLDIKPENLMVTRRGKNLKLIDFGHASSDAYDKKWGGTPNYMLTSDKFDKSDDLFAFGKIIDELLKMNALSVTPELIQLKTICNAIETNNHPSYDELKALLVTRRAHSSNKIWFGVASVVLLIIGVFVYINYATLPKENGVLEEAQTLQNPVLESESENEGISAFAKDSAEIVALMDWFTYTIENEKINQLNMRQRSDFLEQISDSLQQQWFELSSRWEVTSVEYKKAYYLYTELFSEAQMNASKVIYE
jgi:serine/threonine protein kinase